MTAATLATYASLLQLRQHCDIKGLARPQLQLSHCRTSLHTLAQPAQLLLSATARQLAWCAAALKVHTCMSMTGTRGA